MVLRLGEQQKGREWIWCGLKVFVLKFAKWRGRKGEGTAIPITLRRDHIRLSEPAGRFFYDCMRKGGCSR